MKRSTHTHTHRSDGPHNVLNTKTERGDLFLPLFSMTFQNKKKKKRERREEEEPLGRFSLPGVVRIQNIHIHTHNRKNTKKKYLPMNQSCLYGGYDARDALEKKERESGPLWRWRAPYTHIQKKSFWMHNESHTQKRAKPPSGKVGMKERKEGKKNRSQNGRIIEFSLGVVLCVPQMAKKYTGISIDTHKQTEKCQQSCYTQPKEEEKKRAVGQLIRIQHTATIKGIKKKHREKCT